jgi:hypothetical protein
LRKANINQNGDFFMEKTRKQVILSEIGAANTDEERQKLIDELKRETI